MEQHQFQLHIMSVRPDKVFIFVASNKECD